jgi:ABC-type transport system involved in multi-copper enzyme maturation permease subunit
MKSVWIIARMTFREAVRRRIVATGLVLGICFLIIFSVGFHMVIAQINSNYMHAASETEINLMRSQATNFFFLAGMYAVAFLCIAMGALLGADSLTGEINSGAIQTIVTKPIQRSAVVLGKWVGFVGLLGVYYLIIAGGTVVSLLVQANYLAPHLPAGLALIFLEVLLMMTVSLAFSSSFSALATGGAVFGLYGLGFLGGWIEQIGAVLQNTTAVKIGIITSLLIPSESLWRRAAYEMQTPLSSVFGISPFGTTSVPSALMVAYAAVYLLVCLYLGIRNFTTRDL